MRYLCVLAKYRVFMLKHVLHYWTLCLKRINRMSRCYAVTYCVYINFIFTSRIFNYINCVLSSVLLHCTDIHAHKTTLFAYMHNFMGSFLMFTTTTIPVPLPYFFTITFTTSTPLSSFFLVSFSFLPSFHMRYMSYQHYSPLIYFFYTFNIHNLQ